MRLLLKCLIQYNYGSTFFDDRAHGAHVLTGSFLLECLLRLDSQDTITMDMKQ